MSGQKVNVAKSSYCISPSVRPGLAYLIRQLLGVMSSTRTWTYLGVPISGRNLHKVNFQPIISAIEGRITLYSSMYLSLAGRSTLLKDSMLSMPIYTLGHCNVPVGVLKEIDRLSIGLHGSE